jgi:hypothetical protein
MIQPQAAAAAPTLFQVLALILLAAVVVGESIVRIRGWLIRCIILWLPAGLAIYDPDIVQAVATAIGIGRGADVVLYVFVLAFLVTSVIWYAAHARLQRQLTEVVRHLAIQEARRGQGIAKLD